MIQISTFTTAIWSSWVADTMYMGVNVATRDACPVRIVWINSYVAKVFRRYLSITFRNRDLHKLCKKRGILLWMQEITHFPWYLMKALLGEAWAVIVWLSIWILCAGHYRNLYYQEMTKQPGGKDWVGYLQGLGYKWFIWIKRKSRDWHAGWYIPILITTVQTDEFKAEGNFCLHLDSWERLLYEHKSHDPH